MAMNGYQVYDAIRANTFLAMRNRQQALLGLNVSYLRLTFRYTLQRIKRLNDHIRLSHPHTLFLLSCSVATVHYIFTTAQKHLQSVILLLQQVHEVYILPLGTFTSRHFYI